MPSKAKELIDEVEKKKQYRTRVKEVEHNHGLTHIRNLLEQAKKRIVNIINKESGPPHPRERADQFLLGQCHDTLEDVCTKLRRVKETKRKMKESKDE